MQLFNSLRRRDTNTLLGKTSADWEILQSVIPWTSLHLVLSQITNNIPLLAVNRNVLLLDSHLHILSHGHGAYSCI